MTPLTDEELDTILRLHRDTVETRNYWDRRRVVMDYHQALERHGGALVEEVRALRVLVKQLAGREVAPKAAEKPAQGPCACCGHPLDRHSAQGEGLCLDCSCAGWAPRLAVEVVAREEVIGE